jgi:protein-L-isoaspartate(D-aspartate) O-methyltransferase
MPRAAFLFALVVATAALLVASCQTADVPAAKSPHAETAEAPGNPFSAARESMVREQIESRGVTDARVLAAMRAVPRHEFVPTAAQQLAYLDRPLPIGHDQTISQPYIVALMTELAHIGPESTVLEVGTGSGYQAAVLAEIADRVYSIEIVGPLATAATRLLDRLGYENVEIRHGDGYAGWPEHAPFDAIVVTAAPPEVPAALRQQLAVGGRLVIPVGKRAQELLVIERSADGFTERSVLPVRFVPMTNELR